MDEIIQIIQNSDEFNDDVYKTLVVCFGEDNVNKTIELLLRNKNIRIRAYRKLVGECDEDCHYVTSRLFSDVLVKIVKELNDIFASLGFEDCVINRKSIKYKVEKSRKLSEGITSETRKKINELYEQFVAIRNKVVLSNKYLIDNCMKKYADDEKYDVLYQEAWIGLMNACENYDSSCGLFTRYARVCIYYTILRHLYDKEMWMYMPTDISCRYILFCKYYDDFFGLHQRYPMIDEIASQTDFSLEEIRLFILAYNYNNRDLSIDEKLSIDNEYIPLIDCISNFGSFTPSAEDVVIERELPEIIRKILSEYAKTDENIKNINLHYLGGCTFKKIAAVMGYRHRRNSFQKTKSAKKKLRRLLPNEEKLNNLLDGYLRK